MQKLLSVKEQLDIVKRGAVDIYSLEELEKKLALSQRSGKSLRVKVGFDPTSPDIHLGHTVVLKKLRQFQELGHQAVVIIGDFTALIGDPSGQNKTRSPLSIEAVEKNAQTYFDQVGKILDLRTVEIVRNSSWCKPLNMMDILGLASRVTVAQIIQRADFAERLKQQKPVGFHELFYPLMQAYDSVMVKADIELGGTDQTFNLLLGRDLQIAQGMAPQIALTTPLLVGLDGTQKMSKSLGNYIGVTEEAFEMYSKVMSIPDRLMKDYFTLLTDLSEATINELLGPRTHPKIAKQKLARELVQQFHGTSSADEATIRFEQVFSKKEIPNEIPEQAFPITEINNKVCLSKLIHACAAHTGAASRKEATRLISQGAVLVDGTKIIEPNTEITLKDGIIIQVGKKNRFCRIRFK